MKNKEIITVVLIHPFFCSTKIKHLLFWDNILPEKNTFYYVITLIMFYYMFYTLLMI